MWIVFFSKTILAENDRPRKKQRKRRKETGIKDIRTFFSPVQRELAKKTRVRRDQQLLVLTDLK